MPLVHPCTLILYILIIQQAEILHLEVSWVYSEREILPLQLYFFCKTKTRVVFKNNAIN